MSAASGVFGRLKPRARLKQRVRALLDRSVRPYVEEIVGRLSRPVDGWWNQPPPRAFVDLHATLHEARSLALADMPSGAKSILSPGPNGAWYFDWIEDCYGHVERHIGVEAFMARPSQLPPNVEWIEGDVSGPGGVRALPSGSIDLIFSGQNIEHLWPLQMERFFLEANRVLTDRGWLVLDSPNRDLTAAYGWSMAEHTIELTPREAATLIELAGFELETMKGLWLCRRDGEVLPLDPLEDPTGPAGVLRRLALAGKRPDDSFFWWAEARKARRPDASALRDALRSIFEAAWQERINRLRPAPGCHLEKDSTGATHVLAARGRPGEVLIGPWTALPPGEFRFRIPVRWSGGERAACHAATVELWAGAALLDQRPVTTGGDAAGVATVTLHAPPGPTRFGARIRVVSPGTVDLQIPCELEIDPEPWRSAATGEY